MAKRRAARKSAHKCEGKNAKGRVKKGYRIMKGKSCPVKVSRKSR